MKQRKNSKHQPSIYGVDLILYHHQNVILDLNFMQIL